MLLDSSELLGPLVDCVDVSAVPSDPGHLQVRNGHLNMRYTLSMCHILCLHMPCHVTPVVLCLCVAHIVTHVMSHMYVTTSRICYVTHACHIICMQVCVPHVMSCDTHHAMSSVTMSFHMCHTCGVMSYIYMTMSYHMCHTCRIMSCHMSHMHVIS